MWLWFAVLFPAAISTLLLRFSHGPHHSLGMALLKRPSTTALAKTTITSTTAALALILLPRGVRPFVVSPFRLATTAPSRRSFLTPSFPFPSGKTVAMEGSDFPHHRDGYYDGEFTSLPALEDHAREIINRNLERDASSSRTRLCIVIAGGGGKSVSTLAATSGASSLLLEGTIAYDRNSFLQYVGKPDTRGFKFSDAEAASLASVAALKRALNYCSMDDNVRLMPRCIGVGCASALVSSPNPTNGTNATPDENAPPPGRGHIVATRADGLQLTLSVSLEGQQQHLHQLGMKRRTRLEEDICMSHLILKAIERLDEAASDSDFPLSPVNGTTREVKTSAGDCITESWRSAAAQYYSPFEPELEGTTTADKNHVVRNVVESAARRVVDGKEGAVVLLPIYNNGREPISFRCLSVPVLPNHCLIFPGSFNPPHRGHVALANAAIRTLERREPYIHRVHNDKPIFFELSLLNADKPAIDPAVVADRVHQFLQLEDLPQQWGVVLTGAPLFAQKLSNLQDCVTNRLEGPTPRINFVIGTDTLVRVINPKYYSNEEQKMVESLLAMRGAHFIVGGRLEQNGPSSSAAADRPRFVSGQEELEGLPSDLVEMFTIMLESEFRVDVSSSEIRAAQESKNAAGNP
jgi:hypothetical protein